MVQFIRSALSPSELTNDYRECPYREIALGRFKRLMTELDSSVKEWAADRQPMPSELLTNILNTLEFEHEANFERRYRLRPSDAFRISTSTFTKCPLCKTTEPITVSSEHVLKLFTNGCNDVERMLEEKFA